MAPQLIPLHLLASPRLESSINDLVLGGLGFGRLVIQRGRLVKLVVLWDRIQGLHGACSVGILAVLGRVAAPLPVAVNILLLSGYLVVLLLLRELR